GINRDITVKAAFSFKTVSDASNPNPRLQHYGDANAVTDIGATVKYYGKGNVAIDWLRITTPETDEILCGYKDTLLWKCIRVTMDTIMRRNNEGHVSRLCGFYGADEPQYEHILAQQYYNNALNGRLTYKGGGNTLTHYAVNMKLPWREAHCGVHIRSPNPCYPSTSVRYSWLGIPDSATRAQESVRIGKFDVSHKWGCNYDMQNHSHTYDSTRGDSYETFIGVFPSVSKIMKKDSADGRYFKNFVNDDFSLSNPDNADYAGPLVSIEGGVYKHWRYGLLYESQLWWEMSAVVYDWNMGWDFANKLNRNAYCKNTRWYTGEELRFELLFQVGIGAKGLTYDRFYSDKIDTSVVSGFQSGAMVGDLSTFQGMNADSVLMTDLGGSDFLPENEPTTNLTHFITRDSTAKYQGVKPYRIYLGRKTLRREIVKIHDFVYHNESTIMKMKLHSWFAKGYYIRESGDTAAFKRIMKLDTSKILLRPVNRIKPNGTPYYEDSDSTFYDITLHTLKGISLDSQFVMSVHNRRTAPFLIRSDTLRNFSAAVQPTFVTTAEYDSMLALNPSLKYAQVGSREITIPFSYRHPDGKSRLLRIQELTKDSVTKGIDTVLCRDCPLVANYQPGEGKFFRVTVLPPAQRALDSGIVSFTSQRKLVAYPVLEDYNPSTLEPIYDPTHVRYHCVYHKLDSVGRDTTTGATIRRNRVYYKRSRIIERCSPVDVLPANLSLPDDVWEATRVLSDTLFMFNPQGDPTGVLADVEAAFPTIVVRWDKSTLASYCYVAYDARHRGTIGNDWMEYIGECQFPDNDCSNPLPFVLDAKQVQGGIDFLERGHPTVNASDERNFYAYSHSNLGIVVLTRTPSPAIPSRIGVLRERISRYQPRLVDSVFKRDCGHPSMNTYSKPGVPGRNECALVWDEKNIEIDSTDQNWDALRHNRNIYYTSVRMTNSGGLGYRIAFFVPPAIVSNSGGVEMDMGYPNIIRVSTQITQVRNFSEHRIPCVDRMRRVHTPLDTINDDVITWEARNPTCFGTNQCGGAFFMSLRTYDPPDPGVDSIRSYWHGSIFSMQQPIVNASLVSSGKWVGAYHDSDMIANLGLPSPDRGGHIVRNFTGFGGPFVEYNNGVVPQLAAQQLLNNSDQFKVVRRVMNPAPVAGVLNPVLLSSADYLLKSAADDETPWYLMRGYADGTGRFALVDAADKSTTESFAARTPEPRREGVSPDTVATQWFRVQSVKNLDYFIVGSPPAGMKCYYQNRRTMDVVEVDMRRMVRLRNKELVKIKCLVRNGGGDEYRMILTKPSRDAAIVEDIYLGDAQSYMPKLAQENDTEALEIDVSPTLNLTGQQLLHAYPNPATDNVEVVLSPVIDRLRSVHAPVLLDVVDARGEVVMSLQHSAGGTATLNTSGLASGAYTIRCSWLTADMARKTTATHIIISR
ncbi:MAG: T9SS type A sorting domain-containing protein, partial [Candidatus Kapabacteria bacterium]|nr:T9SS type A sorting domain-containing protein [Candidatus Kapabacteria bacterium]